MPTNQAKAQLRRTAITDYREFPNRTHHTVGQAGWEEVADFALEWAKKHAVEQVTYDDVQAAFPASTVTSTTISPELRA